MPGTLLPHETLDELTAMAGRIHDEVMRLDDRDIAFGNGMPAWAYIVEHSIDATVAGLVVGRRLLDEAALPDLATGLFLQDIGMLVLPESLVQKPGPLAPDEWALMMKHPLLGLEFLRDDSVLLRGQVGGSLTSRALGRLRLPGRADRRGDLAVRPDRRGGRRIRRRDERALPRAPRAARRGHGAHPRRLPAKSSTRRSSTPSSGALAR